MNSMTTGALDKEIKRVSRVLNGIQGGSHEGLPSAIQP